MSNGAPDQKHLEAKRGLTWFFHGPSGATRKDVWLWWQQRRLRYYRDLLLVGIVTWVLVLIAGSAAVKPGDDFAEPVTMIFGPVLYVVVANVAYTAGPIIDTIVHRGSPRKRLFKAGYMVSLVLTGLPGAWAVLAWLGTVVTGQKL